MGEMQRVSATPLSPARAAVVDLLSLTPERARQALAPWLAARDEPGYRIDQILDRLWQRPVAHWEQADELPATLPAARQRWFSWAGASHSSTGRPWTPRSPS